MKVFLFRITIAIIFTIQLMASNCRFGPGCTFECNCQNNATCDPESGDCANGCADGPGVTQDVRNMRYVGPGCRIGNVAYRKQTNQSSLYTGTSNLESFHGVDGNTSGNINGGVNGEVYSCIHTDGGISGSQWWMVFLEDFYTIYNITLYARTDKVASDHCLTKVLVRDDTGVTRDCGVCTSGTTSPITVHCAKPLLGNGIIVEKTTTTQSLVFCEAVIFGNIYINVSGQHCLNNSDVYNNITGCPYCDARRLPDCKLECENGTYGVNCNEVCGRCGTNESCGNVNGSCGATGCQTWWHGDACKAEIALIGYNSTENADVAVTSSNGSNINYVNVTWKAIEGVSSDLYSYYQYVVQYRISISTVGTIWLNSTIVNHAAKNRNNELSTTLLDLEFNTEYLVQIVPFRTFGAISEAGSTSAISSFYSGPGPGGDTGGGDSSAGLIAGIAVALIAILVVVILGFVYFRRRQNDEEYIGTVNPITPVIVPQAIPTERPPDPQTVEYVKFGSLIAVDNLLPIVLQMHAENSFGSFENFPKTRENEDCDGNKPENKNKNRYFSKPYDETRVKLRSLSGDEVLESDYINASYMALSGSQPLYIAAEGPKLNTVNDFWRMVWQEQCSAIVMLTSCVENGKKICEQYWPTEIDKDHEYGLIRARMTRVEEFANYIVRRISLTHQGIERVTFQYHFTDWPDRHVPLGAYPLLMLRKAVRSQTQGLLIVHCSAGIGRTGTFIALDKMLDETATQTQIDIDDFISTLRRYRGGMVQTADQYKFLYRAIAEGFLLNSAGQTNINQDQFSDLISDQNFETMLTSQQTILAELANWQRDIVSTNPPTDLVALQPENIGKNRSPNCVPGNLTRPYLITDNDTGSDYFNAVLVHSSRRRERYILTQMPLAHTIHDFWRLVVDFKCIDIVKLNPQGSDQEYWPLEVGKKTVHGSIQVTLSDIDKTSNSLVVRNLLITVGKSREKMHVTHYQLLHWPNETARPQMQPIIELLTLLERAQHSNDSSHPLLIQCMTGCGQSAIFCVLHYVIDMLRRENVIDVFRAVNHVRQGRPEFVPTLTQYRLIYELVKSYLDYNRQHQTAEDNIYENMMSIPNNNNAAAPELHK